ncbi:alanine and glycine-rich protein-like [Alexandromys fortis]|uniref:alanine and glycine-rich protein-like n=1 Tax=Alexandromys fortis TaxID=100897 RepID=UPI002153807F|nr:alanine and glycine-rich protein-like [Microtus fortis]
MKQSMQGPRKKQSRLRGAAGCGVAFAGVRRGSLRRGRRRRHQLQEGGPYRRPPRRASGTGREGGPRGGLRRRWGRPLAWPGLLPAAGSPALRTRHTRRRRGRGRREGGRQLRAAGVARRGLHAWPRGARRTMGASCGDAREGAGLPTGPAGSVSQAAQRHGGGDAGPPRTILTAARPAERAPATRLAAAGARASSATPAPGGGGAGRGGARGLTRGGRSGGGGGGAGPRGRARGDGDARRSARLGCWGARPSPEAGGDASEPAVRHPFPQPH